MLARFLILLVWLSIASQTSQASQTSPKTITLDLKSFHDGQMFYTPMTVGEEEHKKTFRMLVATSNHMTWIVSTNISSEFGYEDRSPVDHHYLRRTYYYNTQFVGRIQYYLHNDTWNLGSGLAPMNNQSFAVIVPFYNNYEMIEGVDGKLGLNDGSNHFDKVDYLFKNLNKSDYIDHLMFSLYINNTAVANRLNNNNDDDSQPEGALVLGGIDARYFTGELKYAKMRDHVRRDLYANKSPYISNIRLDWSRASDEKLDDSIIGLGVFDIKMEQAPLRLDSSVILHSGDNKILDSIHLGIMKADKILDDNVYAFKDCRLDNKPDIIFTLLEGFDVTVTPEEYVIEDKIDNLTLCLSAFKPSREHYWAFGTKLMRKYYTVFDYENDRVGFATPT